MGAKNAWALKESDWAALRVLGRRALLHVTLEIKGIVSHEERESHLDNAYALAYTRAWGPKTVPRKKALLHDKKLKRAL